MSHEEKIQFLREQGETISPSTLARVIGGNPYLYNLAAKDGTLTFPHMWRGRNLRIFTQPVINLLQGGKTT